LDEEWANEMDFLRSMFVGLRSFRKRLVTERLD